MRLNLYNGALKGTPWKWLDLPALFARVLQPDHEVVKVKYFTARVGETCSRPHNLLLCLAVPVSREDAATGRIFYPFRP